MMTQHRKLYTLFNQARRVHFENAYGKLFFMAFCELLLPNLKCLISTNPKGLHQPGSLCVKWVTPGKDTSGSAVIETAQDRVADFVVVNRGFYTVVGKIKGVATGGLYQNLEQMIGLLQKGQKATLGLVVNVIQIS